MSRPITVINVRNVYAYGGSDAALLGWAGALDRSAFVPLLALFANADGAEQPTLDRATALGLQTFLIPGGRRRRLWASTRYLVRLIREHRADVLHLHDVKSNLVGLVAARITGLPAIGAAYGWFGNTSLLRARVYEWLDLRLLRRCEYVLAISDTIREESVALGLPADKVVTMFSGIDYDSLQVTGDRAAVRRSLGGDDGDFLIGNIARLYPEKDQTTLLRAMPGVLAQYPHARLVIVGDGYLQRALQVEAEQLGVAARVSFAGFRNDLSQVLHALDLQVHSSIKEGMPVAVCSGLAAGLPIVSTNIGGVAEFIRHGVTGLLVPPRDARRLSEAILDVLRDRPTAAAMGLRAQRLMREEYRVERVVEKLERLYRDVCARSHGLSQKDRR
jgi:glycosyltransferase involved in cell wall biosynthesis